MRIVRSPGLFLWNVVSLAKEVPYYWYTVYVSVLHIDTWSHIVMYNTVLITRL